MTLSQLEVLQELEKRGKLPEQYRATYDEAVKRDLVDGEKRGSTIMESARVFSGAALEAVPVAGPYIKKGADYLRSMVHGGTPEEQAVETSRLTDRYPKTSFAGGMTGAIAPLFALGATGVGSRALGVTGPSMAARMAAGGASGAAIGGADAAARGNDIGLGTATGGVFGLAAPPVGQAVGSGVAEAMRRVRQPFLPATERVATGLAADEITSPVALALARQKLGPNAMLLNAGENVRTGAERLAQMPGPQMGTVNRAINQQMEGSGPRIRTALDRIMGPPIDIEADIVARRAARKAEANAGFREVFRNARPVNVTPVLEEIDATLRPGIHSVIGGPVRDDSIQGALTRARDMISPGRSQSVSIDVLHSAQQEIYDMATAAARGGRNRQAALLKDVRRSLISQMEDAAPGFRDAQSKFRTASQVMESLDEGRSVFNRTETAQQLRQRLNNMGTEDRRALVQGARDQLEFIMNSTPETLKGNQDAVAIWRRVLNPEGIEKMRLLFGNDRAEQIANLMRQEQRFAGDANSIMQNSATARRMEAQGLFPNPDRPPSRPPMTAYGRLEKVGFGVRDALLNTTRRGMVNRVNNEAANLLTAPLGSPVVEALIARAQRQAMPRSRSIDAISQALLRGGGAMQEYPQ